MATIKDVAKLASVSPSTVSRTLSGKIPVNEKTKLRVLDSVKKLNYSPNTIAKALKECKTKTIAFVLPNIQNMIYPLLAMEVEQEARKHGYFVIFCDTQENQEREQEYIDKLKGSLVDGFLFATALVDDKSNAILKLKEENYPVVCIIRETNNTSNTLVSDNEYGGYLATNYLIDKGFKKIATVIGKTDISVYRDRTKGYLKALKEKGIEVDKNLMWKEIDKDLKSIQNKVLKNFKSGNIPDAIFAQSDPIAFEVLIAISRLGISVPKDVSVIGFDNISYASNFNLTTVEQPIHLMAIDAVKMLISIIENKMEINNLKKIYDVKIIERSSVT